MKCNVGVVIVDDVVVYVGVFIKIVLCVLNYELNISEKMCVKVVEVM